MKTVFRLAASAGILACFVQFVNAQTTYYYNDAGAASAARNWEDTTKWTPNTAFPNAEGDVAIFNSLATANNVAQTANHIVSLNTTTTVTDKTVGEIDFNLDNNNSAARNVIQQGTGGTLIMDGAGATNSKINVTIAPPSAPNTGAMGLDTITAPMQLNDQLQITISNISNRADGLALRLQGSISGAGGITRLGVPSSLLTMIPLTGNTYTYTGPTILDGGRTQISPVGLPTGTTSFTIQGTGQLEPAADGVYQLGSAAAPLILNSDGTGNLGGQGTIRPVRTATRPTQIEFTNSSVVLQAPVSVVHSEGQGANGTDPSQGFIQFDGVISGGPTNKLQFTTTSHSANHGTYVLTGTNTFSGGIDLMAGRLSTDWLQDGGTFVSSTATSHPNANFGTGDIHAVATPSNIAIAISRVTIPSGVLNAIGNSATLSLDGLNDVAFRSAFAELGDNIDEVVGKLVLGGTTQLSGVTYGSTSSSAMFQDNTYFDGTGMVQVGALGDFNGNGSVDAADYVVWRKSYSGNMALYDLWRANYGNTAPGSGSAGGGLVSSAVPEPSTFVLVAMTIAPLVTNRRRRFA
jgi:hypothetical protein